MITPFKSRHLPPLLVASCLLTACAESRPEAPAAIGTSQASPSADAARATSDQVDPQATQSSCTDANGDGPAYELSGAQVRRDGSSVLVSWTVGGDVPPRGTASYTFDATTPDGSALVQYAVTYTDGVQAGHSVRDEQGERPLAGEVGLNDSELTGAFPAPAALSQQFGYSVSTVLDGKVIDRCPEGTETVLHEK